MMKRLVVPALLFVFLSFSVAPTIAAPSAPGDTSTTVTLFDDFSSDTPGLAPNLTIPGAPAGDFLTLNELSGTVRVNAMIDGLTMAAQMKQSNGTGGVALFAWPAAPPANTERITVGWRSVAQDDNPITIVACTVRGSNGALVASIEYGEHGTLVWNGLAGSPETLPVLYRQNRNNAFILSVDLLAQTVSLQIDGVAIAGFQNRAFAQSTTDVARIGFEAGGTAPQTFAADDLFAAAFTRTPDQAPILDAPASVAGEERGHITFTASASDPDGTPIASLTADMDALPAGHTATFTPGAANATGLFDWSPPLGAAGVYPVLLAATSGSLTTEATTVVYVASLGTSTVGRFTWTPTDADVGGSWSVAFTGTNAQNESTTETVPLFVLPADGALSSPTAAAVAPRGGRLAPQAPQRGPIVSVNGSNTGKSGDTMTLTATATSAGTTLAGRFTLQRAGQAGSAASQLITLTADLSGLPAINDAEFVVDEDPVVNVPGPVTAHAGVPVNVQVGAADPDGDPIDSFTAELNTLPVGHNAVFTVNGTNTLGTLSWTPTVPDSGDHFVVFTATNRLVGQNTLTIHVRGVAAARVFQTGARKISLPSGKPFACLQIEPIGGSFSLSSVDFSSIGMISVGTGTVSRISASTGKSVAIADRDGNLIEDVTVCFTKADLRLLFGSLRGSNLVPVLIEGNLTAGGRFQGQITLEVNGGGGKLAAAIYPNPLNPRATLRFTTTKSGFVRVRLFDLNGRMVRDVLDAPTMDPGHHEVDIDGADAAGRPLASGVYFYRVEAREGSSQGRLAVVK